MSDLLKDNMEVERKWATDTNGMPGTRAGSRREVPEVLNWMHSFSLYAAIICSKPPQNTIHPWAYQALMIVKH